MRRGEGANAWPKQVPAVPDGFRSTFGAEAQQRLDDGLEAQRQNLRPTGILMVLLGLVALACSWPVPRISLGVSLLAVVVHASVLLATLGRSATITERR